MSAEEMTASIGGDSDVPKIMLIRRLMTCAGPKSEPMTTAAGPSPSVPSIGTMWARIEASVNPRMAKAADVTIIA